MHSTQVGRQWLESQGFQGFASVAEMRDSELRAAPTLPGVYAVLRHAADRPRFLVRNPAGHFKGDDPTAPRAVLASLWNSASQVVYLGATTRPLRTRLKELVAFGSGQPVGHWGGRVMWQIANAMELLIAWRTTSRTPSDLKSELLREHERLVHRVPFANLRGATGEPHFQ